MNRIFFSNWQLTVWLIPEKQSGFKPGDSCVNHLLSINHKIYHSLENLVFLDISNSSGKIWHEDLILKLNQYGIWENLFRLIKCFLRNFTKELLLMVRHHPGLTSLMMSLKDPFSVHCFSWYNSMIYQMTYLPILNYLQMSLFFQLYRAKK